MKYRIYSKCGLFYVERKWGPFWLHLCRSHWGELVPASYDSQEEAKESAQIYHKELVFKKNNPEKIVEEFELPL